MEEEAPEYRLVNNCVLREDLVYDVEEDVWAAPEEGSVRLGKTDHSQTIAGSVMHANFMVDSGERRDAGRSLMTLESSKWMGVLKAPFDCRVVETNGAVLEEPELINRSPYRRGWLVLLEPEGGEDVESYLEGFVGAGEAEERYEEKMEEMGLDDCVHCEEFEI